MEHSSARKVRQSGSGGGAMHHLMRLPLVERTVVVVSAVRRDKVLLYSIQREALQIEHGPHTHTQPPVVRACACQSHQPPPVAPLCSFLLVGTASGLTVNLPLLPCARSCWWAPRLALP